MKEQTTFTSFEISSMDGMAIPDEESSSSWLKAFVSKEFLLMHHFRVRIVKLCEPNCAV